MQATRHGEESLGYRGAARARMRRNAPGKVEETFLRAQECNARNLRLLAGLAVARRKMGDLEGAAAALDDALRLDPTDPVARFESVQLTRANGEPAARFASPRDERRHESHVPLPSCVSARRAPTAANRRNESRLNSPVPGDAR